MGTTIILVAALFSERSRESGQAGRDGFDLYTLTVVLLRIQGLIYVVYFLFNIGYAYNYLNYIFGSDISSVPHVYVVESWMYLARETLQLVVAFVFLKYANLVAALLVRGLRRR